MPPGTKHKSKLKNNNEIIYGIPRAAFLSRQQSQVDPQNTDIPPRLQLSRNTSAFQPISIEQRQDDTFTTISLNIVLHIQHTKNKIEISSFPCKLNEFHQISIFYLIQDLKTSTFQDIEYLTNSAISIHSPEESNQIKNHQQFTPDLPVYIFLGVDPLPQDCFFQIKNDTTSIEIKARSTKSSLLNQILDQSPIHQKQIKQTKQTKQRNLSEVVERVALWRRLYTGFYDQNKTFIQMSLDKAADKVGIQKKTLDDYLLQIRYGKRYGFNFNQYNAEGISKLRQFVKTRKETKNSKIEN